MLLGVSVIRKIISLNHVETLTKLSGKFFLGPDEQDAYTRTIHYLQKYNTLPPLDSIGNELDDSDHALEYLVEALIERYQRTMLTSIATAIQSEAPIESINKMITSYLFDGGSDSCITQGDELKRVVKESIEKARLNFVRKSLSGYTTGWPTMDRATGGYQDGDIIVFSGRAKTGKTMLMLHSINNILNNHQETNVLLISMEMTQSQVLGRLACLRSKINPQVIRVGNISSFVEKQLLDSMESVKSRFSVVEGNLSRTIDSIIAVIGTCKPDIVFIDGAYLIRNKAMRYERDWEVAKYIIESLKSIALSFKIPIVCSYQLNRSAKKSGDLGLEHLALSDAIGQTASVVIGIVQTDDPLTRQVEIIAVRDGLDEDFTINWDWETLNFSEIGGFHDFTWSTDEERYGDDPEDYAPWAGYEEPVGEDPSRDS